jgi:hypothetical protein
MHLLEQLALSTGVKISDPFIETNYYPLVFDKYIVLENGSEIPSRSYGMWNDVIQEIKPYLDENKISIVQIGDQKDQLIPHAYDLRGKTTQKQIAYLLKKCLLHCSTNDFLLDIASSFKIPVVGMYGNTFADIAKPYWAEESKSVILESHRNGDKPTFLADENPRTINFINPEEISNSILKLLKIKFKNNKKTRFIGKNYFSHVLEVVPDFLPPASFNTDLIINLRMDYHFDLDNLLQWGSNKKINIFTNKIIDLNYLNAIKKNIVAIQQEVCTNLNQKYLNVLKSLQIPCATFTKNERALGNLRMKYFDNQVNFLKDQTFDDFQTKSKKAFSPDVNLYYQSNKLLLSKGKKYLTKYDYINNRDYSGKDLRVVNSADFWADQDHLRVYEKKS